VTRNAQTPAPLSRRLAVAPMMEWTDRHCRYFHRLLTRRALLYTEMISTGAVLHGDRARLVASLDESILGLRPAPTRHTSVTDTRAAAG